MHDVVYGPMHRSVYAFRSKLMHEVVYANLQKPMHEVVYDFFGAPAAGHNRSFRAVCRWQAARQAAWPEDRQPDWKTSNKKGGITCRLFDV